MKRRARYAAMLVGCVGFAATLSVAGGGFEPLGSDTAAALEDQRVELFSLNEIIEPAASDPLLAPVATPVASVLTVVEAAIAAAREEGDPPARVTFHDESGLLILRGEDAEIEAVRQALELIREDIRRVREEVANQDRTARIGIVQLTPEVDKVRRAEMEAQLKMAMIGIERAQLEMRLREERLDESEQLAQTGAVSKSELRALRAALEHARLAVHESEVRAEATRRQLETVGKGPQAIAEGRKAQAESEFRMAMVAVERAQMELATREAELADATTMAEKDFVSEREVRERQVAREHARLGLEQAEVMLNQMRVKRQEASKLPEAEIARREVDRITERVTALRDEKKLIMDMMAAGQGANSAVKDRVQHHELLLTRLGQTNQVITLLESRLAEVASTVNMSEKRQASNTAVQVELARRVDQLARLQAEIDAVRDREAQNERNMVMQCTRLEVRLEETQRVLERKHAECADLSDHLREMMVRVDVEAVRRHSLEAEIQRLREALERGKE